MIIVADTGPLNYLVLIRYIDVLQVIYGRVVIPPAVQDELLAARAPASVRAWINNPPAWLEIQTPCPIDPQINPALDDGEREALALMQNANPPALLLIDDLPARMEAIRLGFEIIGTLGVLLVAHKRNLLDIREAIERLRNTSFNATDSLIQHFLSQA